MSASATRKRTTPRRPAPVARPPVDPEAVRKARIDALISFQPQEAIEALTAELGQMHQQLLMNGRLINRLVNHILTIDPDDSLGQQVRDDLQTEGQE